MNSSDGIDTSARAWADSPSGRTGSCRLARRGSEPGGANRSTVWPRFRSASVIAHTCAWVPPANGWRIGDRAGAIRTSRYVMTTPLKLMARCSDRNSGPAGPPARAKPSRTPVPTGQPAVTAQRGDFITGPGFPAPRTRHRYVAGGGNSLGDELIL